MRTTKRKPRARAKRTAPHATRPVSKLLDAALKLSDEERHEIAVILLDSLPEPGVSQAGVDAAWGAEIKRRLDDIDSGRVKMIPAEQVHRELRKRLRGRTSR